MANTIWLGHCRDRAPLIVVEPGGCSGPGADVISLAIEKLGHQVVWMDVPWARTITVAREGEVDLIPLHSMDEEREKFLDPILLGFNERVLYFFKRADNPLVVASVDDLKGISIGALRGSFYSEQFNALMDDLSINYVTNSEQIIQMLKAGRIDLAVTSELHGMESFKQGSALVEVPYREVTLNGRFFSVPRSSENHGYIDELRAVIDSMRLSGEIITIFERHGVEAPVSGN